MCGVGRRARVGWGVVEVCVWEGVEDAAWRA